MIIIGVVLLIIGFVADLPIVWTLSIIAVVLGAVLFIAGRLGHAVAGRKHWF
jgi:uncharacterized membrane protein HdeD (DUF308 family)